MQEFERNEGKLPEVKKNMERNLEDGAKNGSKSGGPERCTEILHSGCPAPPIVCYQLSYRKNVNDDEGDHKRQNLNKIRFLSTLFIFPNPRNQILQDIPQSL